MLTNLHLTYKIPAICVERSFANKGLIATVAYQTSNYTWACKTAGSISGNLSDKRLVKSVLKYGTGLNKEPALNTFDLKELDFRYEI